MTGGIVVAGTDTGVGKTVVAAALARALDAAYWKPVQAGLDGETDSQTALRLSGLDPARILPSAYALRLPASPHIAARREGLEIDAARLVLPAAPRPLVVECAGGLMVPLSRSVLQIEMIGKWKLPVVLVARTALGTINHTLLSLEALGRRAIPVAGITLVGEAEPEVEATIAERAGAPVLGRLPILAALSADTLAAAFAAAVDVGPLRAAG